MSGATSGLFSFQLSNSGVIFEAFDRIGKRPPQVDRHMVASARISLNLELLDWSNEGWNFWKTTSGTINLAANQPTYALPPDLVTIEELYYSQLNTLGSGINSDRMMVPITRTQYAAVVNKLQPGIPSQYWFQMLDPPQVTIWPVPAMGQVAPSFVLNWFGLQQMEDANPYGGEVPDIHYRATDTLCAKMAVRLCEKFGPEDADSRTELMTEKKMIADASWMALQRRDQEPGNVTFRPMVYPYARM